MAVWVSAISLFMAAVSVIQERNCRHLAKAIFRDEVVQGDGFGLVLGEESVKGVGVLVEKTRVLAQSPRRRALWELLSYPCPGAGLGSGRDHRTH
jgi:hypothetical protein